MVFEKKDQKFFDFFWQNKKSYYLCRPERGEAVTAGDFRKVDGGDCEE
jgi:hypothetical protein